MLKNIFDMFKPKENFPLVSIVVPCWNEENFIQDCLQSIKQQTFNDFEVIIVDDASVDRTAEIVQREISTDKRFKYYRMPQNSGTGEALNFGFNLARGKYWTWIAGDSSVEPAFLKEHVQVLNDQPQQVVLAYSDWYLEDDISDSTTTIETPDYNKSHLRIQCIVGPCFLFRKEAKLKAGPYCKQICEDYYMHLMMAEQGDFVRIPKRLGMWRNHKNNLTNRVSIKSKWMESSIAKSKARWKSAKRRVAYI